MTWRQRYRTHPPVGITRNTLPSEHFFGTKVPGQSIERSSDIATPTPPFKSDDLIKRQAARLGVWEYVGSD